MAARLTLPSQYIVCVYIRIYEHHIGEYDAAVKHGCCEASCFEKCHDPTTLTNVLKEGRVVLHFR